MSASKFPGYIPLPDFLRAMAEFLEEPPTYTETYHMVLEGQIAAVRGGRGWLCRKAEAPEAAAAIERRRRLKNEARGRRHPQPAPAA